ncbi:MULTISPECIES: hypothetical protein [Acinetobacter]|nr:MULTISPECIES: hypothetical protein [Acinetobacter]KCY55998.1 hypothetical protein J608_3776 [Acinetobacter baumannii 1288284]EXB77749.1 hypothetical protein J551_1634 [Acinetobacter sp. 1475718]EXR98521.1 hypothetical protein J687_3174 [Acinetobacter sp. 225588]EYT44323.1 hypothetical protein J619_03291 [Acinetobacter sp. 478810]KAF0599909.1 hypothetical protein AB71190_03288 [Acinetobacter baumannii]
MRAECREQVAKALGKRKLSAADSNRISSLYIRAQNTLARTDPDWMFKSPAERAEAIAQKTATDLAVQIAKNNQNIARDAIIKAQLQNEIYNHPKLNPVQALMRKIAYFSDQSGIQSIEKQSQALHSRWMSLVADVFTKTQERFGMSVNKAMTDDIIRVMFGGKSDNPEITAMAKEVSAALEEMRLAFNRAGGNIKKLDNFGFMTSHDQKKVALTDQSEWVNDALAGVDRNQYVKETGELMDELELKSMLEEIYKTISTNGANKDLLILNKQAKAGASPVGGRSKMANRHQESRALHFKDGDAWLAYQKKYGTYDEAGFHEILKNHTHRMSTEVAMMQNLGSNPRNTFESLLDEAKIKLKADPQNGMKHGEIDKQAHRAMSMYNTLDANTRAIDSTLGNVMGGLRALMVASKLGGTTLTTFGDHASMKKVANMLGLSYTKSILPEYMKQLKQGATRDEALRFGLGINEMAGSMTRFGDADIVSSATKSGRFNARMQAFAATTMKLSGLNAVTAGAKRALNLVHMNKLAEMTRKTDWKDLGADDLKILQGNGITERDWQLWQQLEPSKREDGTAVLTQNDFFSAPDDIFINFASPELKALKDEIDAQILELNDRNAIDDLRIKNREQKLDDIKRSLSQRLLDYANRKDAQAQAEKQALQDRIDLIDAQKEASAAQADLNTYIRTIENQEDLKGFIDGITQGKTIDNLTDKAKKLGRTLESLDNKVVTKTTRLNDKIKTFEKEIQGKFSDFTELLNSKSKLSKDKLIEYEGKLSERLNRYASRRDVNVQKELDALNELKDLVALKQERLDTDFEVRKAQEQTRIKQKTDQKIDSSISRNSRRNYKSGEDLGYRLGNAERRMTELRTKMRSTDSSANKAVTQKYKELDKRVNTLDAEFIEYQTKVAERQEKRQHVMDRLNNSITPRQKELLADARYKAAMKYQTHIFNEESVAIIEAGVRERSIINLGEAGTIQGELGRTLFQFKGFPLAYMFRIGHRAFAQGDVKSRVTFLASLLAYQTLAGALIVQTQNLANGKNPEPVFTIDFFGKSLLKGGGLSFLGDIMSALSDPTGRSASDFISGPLLGQSMKLGMLLTGMGNNIIEGKESTRMMEVANTLKSNIPLQNLWYSKLVVDRMLYSKMQNMIDPDYLPRTQQRLENLGNSYWWDLSEE